MEFVAAQMRRWGPSLVGLIIAIVGLGGAPDDLRVWGNWIGDFVEGDGFRLLLVAVGIAIMVIANVPGLRRLSIAAWHIMVGADSSPAKPASATLAPAEMHETPSPQIELRLVLGEENWVHIEVTNNGGTDEFVAKVIEVEEGVHTLPWSIKWRDVDTEERRILQGDLALLNLATFELPDPDIINVDYGPFGDGQAGRYRLYSISQPSGFDFSENWFSTMDELTFTPHKIRIRIAAVNQPMLHIERTIALGFRAYVKGGGVGFKPDIHVDEI